MSHPPKPGKSGWIPVSSDKLQKLGQALPRPAEPPSEAAIRRAAQTHTLHTTRTLGAPLAQQISAHPQANDGKKPNVALYIAGLGAMSTTMLVSFLVQAPVAVLALAGVGSVGIALKLAHGLFTYAPPQNLHAELDVAQQFDQCLAQYGPHLPETTCALLQTIKNALAQLLPRLPQIKTGFLLKGDDVFYITQAASRYVPDALATFTAIHRNEQATAISVDGKSAQVLLDEQLELVVQKLAQIQQELLQQDGQKLLMQKRFLQEKN